MHDALAIIRQREPDVLLLDINPHSYSGLEIVRSVAAGVATRYLPIRYLAEKLAHQPDKRAWGRSRARRGLTPPVKQFSG